MTWFLLFTLLAVNGLLLATLSQQRCQRENLVAILRQVRAFIEQVREAELRKTELIEKQKVAEKAIDAGSIGVETVHKAIAGLTFGILDAIPATRATSSLVREVHDASAAGSYEAVRKLNREVGKLIQEVVGNPARLDDRGRRNVAKGDGKGEGTGGGKPS